MSTSFANIESGLAFGPESAHLEALDAVLTGLEEVEVRIRQAEAERVTLLARAFDLALAESRSTGQVRSDLAATDVVPNDVAGTGVAGEPVAAGPSAAVSGLAMRAVRAEIALCLRVSEQTIDRRMTHAYTLTREYPIVFEAYRDGRLSERHTPVIIEAGLLIGHGESPGVVARRAGYEQAVLGSALGDTSNRLRPVAKRLAEQFSERSLDERHAVARQQRRVWVEDRDDGMADLYAHLPAVEAYAIKDRLNRMAKQIAESEEAAQKQAGQAHAGQAQAGQAQLFQRTHTGKRSRDEIRADLLAELLLEGQKDCAASATPGEPGQARISGRVQVIVHQSALLEQQRLFEQQHLSEQPHLLEQHQRFEQHRLFEQSDPLKASGSGRFAPRMSPPEMQGYGPIDTFSARGIAADAEHWDRIIEDPSNGEVLAVDRYRPSEHMRRVLRVRDQHCRFPGCRSPLHRCDLDHTVDAQFGGPTSVENLAFLCRGHHMLKHHTAWQSTQLAAGALEWRSPTGRHYRDTPSRVSFVPVMPASGGPPHQSQPQSPPHNSPHNSPQDSCFEPPPRSCAEIPGESFAELSEESSVESPEESCVESPHEPTTSQDETSQDEESPF